MGLRVRMPGDFFERATLTKYPSGALSILLSGYEVPIAYRRATLEPMRV